MDEYAEYLYKRRPHYRNIDPGDLTKQKDLRKQLQCKPFKWFMENVAFDLPKKYPPVEPPDIAKGRVSPISHFLKKTKFPSEFVPCAFSNCVWNSLRYAVLWLVICVLTLMDKEKIRDLVFHLVIQITLIR